MLQGAHQPHLRLPSALDGAVKDINGVAKAHPEAAAMPGLLISSLSCFYLLLLFPLISKSDSEEQGVVVTSSGPIKGKDLPVGSGFVSAYLGIPYAEPPLGKLRFQKPVPHQPWSQVFEATRFGNACPQFFSLGFLEAKIWAANRPLSEDCLFLNVWVPHPPPSSPTPVLVWIHGGGFLIGTSSLDMYNGARLAYHENVIVVTINYRLGALGFLSLPPAAPGNMGLLDQQLALKWVQENAAAFGGDPTRVTLFGQSAGAASVGFHLLSPSSQPLFAQAVPQSGAPNAIWAWKSPEEAKQNALNFSQLLGCAEGNDTAVVSCLQEKDAMELVQHEVSLLQNTKFLLVIPFVPTTDGDFLLDEPQKLLEAGKIQHKPILMGVTSDEGSTFVPFLFPDTNHSLISWEQLLKGIGMTMQREPDEAVEAVALKYSEGHGPAKYRWSLSQFIGDFIIECSSTKFLSKLREAGIPVYIYSFTHHTSGSAMPEWTGAFHGAEIPYVFGTLESVVGVSRTYTEAEGALGRRMMRYWAEFSRSGNPTGSVANEVQWPLYNATQQNFFNLSTEPSLIMETSPARHCSFLESLFLKAANPLKGRRHLPSAALLWSCIGGLSRQMAAPDCSPSSQAGGRGWASGPMATGTPPCFSSVGGRTLGP
ncbi:cholinesterase-like isoform X3 [Elgaria multicarinata webbii]|uniref:cholinesterase-like isoform X3 n=1 Tax=Elgaria multicarinata webbii TaxID=159646 RepID=UPI002FCCFDCA